MPNYNPPKEKTPTRMVNGRPTRTRNTSLREDMRESISSAARLAGGMFGKARDGIDAKRRAQSTDHEN